MVPFLRPSGFGWIRVKALSQYKQLSRSFTLAPRPEDFHSHPMRPHCPFSVRARSRSQLHPPATWARAQTPDRRPNKTTKHDNETRQ